MGNTNTTQALTRLVAAAGGRLVATAGELLGMLDAEDRPPGGARGLSRALEGLDLAAVGLKLERYRSNGRSGRSRMLALLSVEPEAGRAATPEALPEVAAEGAPGDLGPVGARLWRRVVEVFELEGWQLELLESAARSTDRAETARRRIEADGLTVTDRSGAVRAHPLAAVERDARAAAVRALTALGLSDDEKG